MAIGLVIYFVYGINNSVLGAGKPAPRVDDLATTAAGSLE
jgi:hypothetical protein